MYPKRRGQEILEKGREGGGDRDNLMQGENNVVLSMTVTAPHAPVESSQGYQAQDFTQAYSWVKQQGSIILCPSPHSPRSLRRLTTYTSVNTQIEN